jgi:hypothetical protein
MPRQWRQRVNRPLQASPGILVQFAIMELVTCGQILVQERTLQRMLTTSMRPWQIVAGHGPGDVCFGVWTDRLAGGFRPTGPGCQRWWGMRWASSPWWCGGFGK